MNNLYILPPGTEVGFVDTDGRGIITDVSIKDGPSISYSVSWWNGGTHNEQWFPSYKIASDCDRVPIGFITRGSK